MELFSYYGFNLLTWTEIKDEKKKIEMITKESKTHLTREIVHPKTDWWYSWWILFYISGKAGQGLRHSKDLPPRHHSASASCWLLSLKREKNQSILPSWFKISQGKNTQGNKLLVACKERAESCTRAGVSCKTQKILMGKRGGEMQGGPNHFTRASNAEDTYFPLTEILSRGNWGRTCVCVCVWGG